MSQLIVVCGWPLSGKNTIAKLVAAEIGARFIDIDDVRFLAFGKPPQNPAESQEMGDLDRHQMQSSYTILLCMAGLNLQLRNDLVIAATFSRQVYRDQLAQMMRQYPSARLKLIQCVPRSDTTAEIDSRLALRRADPTFVSNVSTMERYVEVKSRYTPIQEEHLEIDTSPPHTPTECAQGALAYIRS